MFNTLESARRKNALWRCDYNALRPHSSLGDMTLLKKCAGRLRYLTALRSARLSRHHPLTTNLNRQMTLSPRDQRGQVSHRIADNPSEGQRRAKGDPRPRIRPRHHRIDIVAAGVKPRDGCALGVLHPALRVDG